MHDLIQDLINLAQVLTPIILGVLTWNLNSKKTKHDSLADDNDRIVKENKRLTKLNAEKDKEINNLLKERNRN